MTRKIDAGRSALGMTNKFEEPKGRTIQGIDYRRIEYTKEEISHARGIVAANSKDAKDARSILEHLGLLPEQEAKWYEWVSESPTTPGTSTGRGSLSSEPPPTTASDSGA